MAWLAQRTTTWLLCMAGIALCTAALAFCAVTPTAFADEGHSQVAHQSEMAAARELGFAGMEAITGESVKDGTYDVKVDSSSSFFKVESAQLQVEGGEMTATIKLRSNSYLLVYMGTGEEAAAAPAQDYIEFNAEDRSFTIPVEALDTNIDCAAFSKARTKWYDRKLLFYANSLPADALLVELPTYGEALDGSGKTIDGSTSGTNTGAANDSNSSSAATPDMPPEAVAIDLPDGEYSIEVNMTGGSGRASISSPTWLYIEDGKAYARLLWSSSYYDYMLVDEYRFDNLTTDGSNSAFKIPITALDEEIDVIADTTAMGDPVEIEYHITFYSETIGEKNLIPQEAAILVLEIAVIIIVVGGILNYVLKKRRKR